ncbi:MAG TPA: DUF2270 domain-containing protein [Longimicrobiaceae bacterium]|nr:DUF2270 domain-containing protein [Longimicrobiaceae bacterium]
MAGGPDAAHPVLVHFYRAVVSHMDVWRQRMDATTNWAAATTAAMVTFSFGSVDSPHFVLLLALGFDGVFLLMESRHYQVFDLWRRRFRLLNRYLVVPVLTDGASSSPEEQRDALARVAEDLGRMVPHLRLAQAMGYRIRRNYAHLFAVGLVAWVLKLEVHPAAAESVGELVRRAAVGVVPGPAVMALLGAVGVCVLVLALRAPSEQMVDWTDPPAPLDRWISRSLAWGRGIGRGRGGGPAR